MLRNTISTLENIQQLMELISGPTGEGEMEEKLKCRGRSIRVSPGGRTGTEHTTECDRFHRNTWKNKMCLLFKALSGELMKQIAFPFTHALLSHAVTECLSTQHKRGASALPSLNMGGSIPYS